MNNYRVIAHGGAFYVLREDIKRAVIMSDHSEAQLLADILNELNALSKDKANEIWDSLISQPFTQLVAAPEGGQ